MVFLHIWFWWELTLGLRATPHCSWNSILRKWLDNFEANAIFTLLTEVKWALRMRLNPSNCPGKGKRWLPSLTCWSLYTCLWCQAILHVSPQPFLLIQASLLNFCLCQIIPVWVLCLFIYFEKERESEQNWGWGQRGRERISSRLRTVSAEPDTGIHLMNHEIKTWAEIKSQMVNQLSHRCPSLAQS